MIINQVSKKLVVGTLLALSIALPLSSSIAAGPGQRADRPDRPDAPPKEAIAACADLTEGAACSFSGSRGDVTGMCTAPPTGGEGPLACKPEGGPPGR